MLADGLKVGILIGLKVDRLIGIKGQLKWNSFLIKCVAILQLHSKTNIFKIYRNRKDVMMV